MASLLVPTLWEEDHIAQVNVVGNIGPGATEFIKDVVDKALEKSTVRSIIFYVDSGGGSPVEAWRFCQYLDIKRREEAKKPEHTRRSFIAVIGETGASAAYHMSACTDAVYTNPSGSVGSIGVVIFYDPDAPQVGHIASGRAKVFDLKNPEVRIQAEEDVKEDAKFFLEIIQKLRGSRLKLSKEELETGRVWNGRDALKYGLVDHLGTPETVAEALKLPVVQYEFEVTLWDRVKDVLSVLKPEPKT